MTKTKNLCKLCPMKRYAKTSVLLVGLLLLPLLSLLSQTPTTVPSQVRLSFGPDPKTTVSVVWHTQTETQTSTVQNGESEKLGKTADGKTVSYEYQTNIIHEAQIKNLSPDKKYFYRAGDSAGGWSKIFSFKTAPKESKPFTFTAWGDQGTSKNSMKNVSLALAEFPAFHLMLGDISYANGNQPVWDTWGLTAEPLTSMVPFMTTIGNHENEKIAGKRIGYVSYLARFAMPGNEQWYFFDYCGVRFIAFNSDDYGNKEQLKWFGEILKKTSQDKNIHWVIVFEHHPLYGSTKNRGNNVGLIMTQQSILDSFKVDLVLAGHDHVYERMYPMKGGKATTSEMHSYKKGQGTLYVVSGGGGNPLYAFMPEKPAVTAYREVLHHYLRIKVDPQSSIRVEAVKTIGKTRDVVDWFEIKK